MKIWAVANQKGGVGKTTTAVSLAGLLSLKGHRTLMVDLDPHGSMTGYFSIDPEEVEPSVYDLFDLNSVVDDPEQIIVKTPFENLDLMPASTALATLDRQIGQRKGMGLIVDKTLAKLKGKYDNVVLDCPPMLGVLMLNALTAAQHLLIPVQTEHLALKGLERMMHTLAMVQRSRPKPLEITIIPTMFDQRTRASIDTLRSMQKDHAEYLWKGLVPVDTKFREASKKFTPLTIDQPWCKGSLAYRKLLDALLADSYEGEQAESP